MGLGAGETDTVELVFVSGGTREPDAVELVFMGIGIGELDIVSPEGEMGTDVVGTGLRVNVVSVRLGTAVLVNITPPDVVLGALVVGRLLDNREVLFFGSGPVEVPAVVLVGKALLDDSILEIVSDPVFGANEAFKDGTTVPDREPLVSMLMVPGELVSVRILLGNPEEVFTVGNIELDIRLLVDTVVIPNELDSVAILVRTSDEAFMIGFIELVVTRLVGMVMILDKLVSVGSLMERLLDTLVGTSEDVFAIGTSELDTVPLADKLMILNELDSVRTLVGISEDVSTPGPVVLDSVLIVTVVLMVDKGVSVEKLVGVGMGLLVVDVTFHGSRELLVNDEVEEVRVIRTVVVPPVTVTRSISF